MNEPIARQDLNDMTATEIDRTFAELPAGLQKAIKIEGILGATCEFCHRIVKPGHFCMEGFEEETACEKVANDLRSDDLERKPLTF